MDRTPIQQALIEAGFVSPPLLTREQFKANLIAHGKSIKSWAHEHGFEPNQVSIVLTSGIKCSRGKSHEIAIAMGIKAKPKE